MKQFLVILIAVGFWGSCANIVSPTGGPRDERPPKLIEEESTKNFQTNFTERGFELTYDEWIQLRDVFNQVLISPPLAERPEVIIRKRTVEFEFDEDEILRSDATYVINFGDAIQDLTEGNPAEMVFVFSTGDYIDSLTIKGEIVDAFSGEPVKEVLCLAYDNLADTVVRTERPFYFARTDEAGQFEIKNVKSDTFKIVALIDGNLNYLYDNEQEKFGYLDTSIIVSDSITPNVKIRIFEGEEPLFLREDIQEVYGHIKLVFNRDPYDADINYDDVGQYLYMETEKDTVHVWYNQQGALNWNLYSKRDTIIDTVRVETLDKAAFFQEEQIEIKSSPQEEANPQKTLKLELNHPLFTIDTSKVNILEDSLKTRVATDIQIDSLLPRQLNLNFKWKPGVSYQLQFLPGSIIDRFGISNQDSLIQTQRMATVKDFGNINLKFIDLEKEKAYVVRVLNKNDQLIEEFTIADSENFQKELKSLPPGNYKLEFIEDINRDERWTTGNYDLKLQPELILFEDLEELRANWDVEAEISASNFQ